MYPSSHAPGMVFVAHEHIFSSGFAGLRTTVLSRSRAFTLFIALGIFTVNIFSLAILHHFPKSYADRYDVISPYTIYLYLANLVLIVGFVGAIRQHPFSINIFAYFLALDSLVSTIGRSLFLAHTFWFSNSHFCDTPRPPLRERPPIRPQSANVRVQEDVKSRVGVYADWWVQGGSRGRLARCQRVVQIAQVLLCAGVVIAAVMQVLGAMEVRRYERGLRRRQMNSSPAGWDDGYGDVELPSEVVEAGDESN